MSDHFDSAFLTDLYELTMAAAYFENNLRAHGSFELFVRSLPPQRGFLLAAGLEQCLKFLEKLVFRGEEIEYLRSQPVFRQISPAFFDYLKTFHFSGEVWAVPEGTAVFAEEPLLRVTAPMIEAQIAETFLLSMLTFQTMIASKAVRVVQAAQGRQVVEFGSRRAHGPEAGVLAARAAWIGGPPGLPTLRPADATEYRCLGPWRTLSSWLTAVKARLFENFTAFSPIALSWSIRTTLWLPCKGLFRPVSAPVLFAWTVVSW